MAEWGRAVVEQLAEYLQQAFPDQRGFSAANLWRMRQFFETYRDQPILAPLVRELDWTHHLLILGRCKRPEDREFYIRLTFYLEALDRDVKKPLECPSIGVLLCASKNDEVVEYALSRTLSPALVAEYQTRLPSKALLQRKRAEFYELESTRRCE